ncbi:hypothetical protein EOL96_01020 [Candidatus Saccharibacteria bacterium]|nr:hypothetical protein [Candidatus Saccharibacteria bacterium]
MSEKLPNPTEQARLEDVTTEARAHILNALNEKRNDAARPSHLFIELPGHVIKYSVHESDCSGHWTEDHSFTLTDSPHRITSISTDRRGLQLRIASSERDTYGLETTLSRNDVSRAKFYVEEVASDDQALTATLYKQLRAHSAVWINKKALDEMSGWEAEVGIRAAHPLSSPVSIRDINGVNALDTCSIVGVQSFYDEEKSRTMVQVVIDKRRGSEYSSSDWARLEDFEFYLDKYSETTATLGRIAHEATRLLDSDSSTDIINQLLVDTEFRVGYEVLYDRFHHNQTARFVVGEVARGDRITHIHTPRLHRYSDTRHAALLADRVVMHDDAPWVVDHASSLATPLIAPEKFTNLEKHYELASVEQLIVHEQTD